ncbi:MAG TPA: helix-turn-helix domain-containing protein [Nevskiaceae bacterium]|nr:helix-turn-helix domain-containing protein [Nevskiaceae bacterium]
MTASAAKVRQTSARVGRPPRVSVAAIIEAAREIGLERVTLKEIADKLGVALATLYRHVKNRDELVRLAAFEAALERRLPDSTHAHWTELATRYAETLFESFVAEPQMIAELLKGRIGPHAEVDVLEQFLTEIAKHGFSEEEGVRLFHAIGTLTIGAAAGAIGWNASRSAGTPWTDSLRRTLAERDADELPRVRRVLPRGIDTNPHQWRPALDALLAGIAAQRGQDLKRRPR